MEKTDVDVSKIKVNAEALLRGEDIYCKLREAIYNGDKVEHYDPHTDNWSPIDVGRTNKVFSDLDLNNYRIVNKTPLYLRVYKTKDGGYKLHLSKSKVAFTSPSVMFMKWVGNVVVDDNPDW